jgi:hypothetical protein
VGSSVILPPAGQPGPMLPGEFARGSVPNLVTFGFNNVGPPSPLYMQRDDTILIEGAATSAQTVRFVYRLLLPYNVAAGQPETPPIDPSKLYTAGPGTIVTGAVDLKIQNNSATWTSTLNLGECYLLAISAQTGGGTVRGQVFARAILQRAGTTSGGFAPAGWPLFADYTTLTEPIGWPGGRVLNLADGPGAMALFTVGNPAAGADWSFTLTANQKMRIQSFNAQLVTSATVANRIVRTLVNPAGNINPVWQAPPSQVIPASTTAQVSAASGQFTATTDTTTVNVALPSPLLMGPTDVVQVKTLNLQVGDQWSNIAIHAEAWIAAL